MDTESVHSHMVDTRYVTDNVTAAQWLCGIHVAQVPFRPIANLLPIQEMTAAGVRFRPACNRMDHRLARAMHERLQYHSTYTQVNSRPTLGTDKRASTRVQDYQTTLHAREADTRDRRDTTLQLLIATTQQAQHHSTGNTKTYPSTHRCASHYQLSHLTPRTSHELTVQHTAPLHHIALIPLTLPHSTLDRYRRSTHCCFLSHSILCLPSQGQRRTKADCLLTILHGMR
jgi:hypothetical protein